MKLRIDEVHGHGNAQQERVLLTVIEDTDLKYFIVADTTYTADGQSISNKFRHTKWFQPWPVKKGDRVALWTKHGTDATSLHDGVRWHQFYWNSGAAIWNDAGDGAILFQLADWRTTRAR